jgi:hypothetical protein
VAVGEALPVDVTSIAGVALDVPGFGVWQLHRWCHRRDESEFAVGRLGIEITDIAEELVGFRLGAWNGILIEVGRGDVEDTHHSDRWSRHGGKNAGEADRSSARSLTHDQRLAVKGDVGSIAEKDRLRRRLDRRSFLGDGFFGRLGFSRVFPRDRADRGDRLFSVRELPHFELAVGAFVHREVRIDRHAVE